MIAPLGAWRYKALGALGVLLALPAYVWLVRAHAGLWDWAPPVLVALWLVGLVLLVVGFVLDMRAIRVQLQGRE
jgi:hypothetical protein